MKKVIGIILIVIVLLLATCIGVMYNAGNQYQKEYDAYLAEKEKSDVITTEVLNITNDSYKSIAEEANAKQTLSFIPNPGENTFSNASVTWDEDVLSFYRSKYIEMSYIDTFAELIPNEITFLIKFRSDAGQTFYINAAAEFIVPDAADYPGAYSLTRDITLDNIHYYIVDTNGDVLIDIATLSNDGAIVNNNYIMLNDIFVAKNHEAYMTISSKENMMLDLTYSLVMDGSGNVYQIEVPEPVQRACDSMFVDLFKLETIFEVEPVTGYYYDPTGLLRIDNAEYPDFNGEFNQNTALNDLYNERYADWSSWSNFDSWDDKLIFECSFINSVNYERHFFLLVSIDLNSTEKDSNITSLYELINGEYVAITADTLDSLEGFEMTALEEAYICNGDTYWYESLTNIGERDLPSYLFSLIFKEIE